MGARDRAADRGRRIGRRLLAQLAEELRVSRSAVGARQADLAREAHMSESKVGRYESGRDESATLVDMATLLAAAGLGMKVSTYPLGDPPRDAAQAAGLADLLANVCPPLIWRTEVALPNPGDYRAWDARIDGGSARTGVEWESRLGDIQALGRRLALKRRDGGVDHVLVVVADTRHNRAVLRDYPTLLPDLPRLRRAAVLAALQDGQHPGDGIVLF